MPKEILRAHNAEKFPSGDLREREMERDGVVSALVNQSSSARLSTATAAPTPASEVRTSRFRAAPDSGRSRSRPRGVGGGNAGGRKTLRCEKRLDRCAAVGA